MVANNLYEFGQLINGEGVMGITSGVFDLLHPLQVLYLNNCAARCDKLFVLIDSDDMVREKKSKSPIFNQNDRAYMVDNLACVTHVMIMRNLDDLRWAASKLAVGNPTKMFKNKDTIYGDKVIEIDGVTLEIIPDVQRLSSTTEIINHIKTTNLL